MNSGPLPELPDFNVPKYEDLILSLREGTCIFIGAGISKLAGYKLWDELRKEMIDYLWTRRNSLSFDQEMCLDLSMCEELKKHEDIIEAFDYLYKIDKKLFVSGMKEIFASDDKRVVNKIYQVLNKLNNGKNFFVTTNIAMGFQKYLGLTDESVPIYPEFHKPLKLINYLHGRIDKEDTWIFTRAQYDNGYFKGEAPCAKFLKYIFENYNVLFIGYGLREREIQTVISSTDKRKTHYWIEGVSRKNEDHLKIRSTSLKENYNINLIPYYIDQKGHELLYEVINLLYESIKK